MPSSPASSSIAFHRLSCAQSSQRWQPVRPTGPRGCSSISRYPIVASPGGARKRSTPRCTASSARPRDCRPAASLRRTNCCAHTGFVSPPTGSSRMVCCGPISGGVEPVWCKQPAHGTDPGQRGCLVAPTPSLRKRVRGRAAARPLMCRLASERGGPVSAGT